MPNNEIPIYRNLPLYKFLSISDSTESILEKEFLNKANHGLLFDKYFDTWGVAGGDFSVQEPSNKPHASLQAKLGSKTCFLSEIIKSYNDERSINDRLKAYHKKRILLFDALDAKILMATTDWRFVSGFSSSHPFEAGFIWHRMLGVPYLPGSSVKGMMRTWATHWRDIDESEIARMFGVENLKDGGDTESGSLIVFDALPQKPPVLELDILNPHYAPYYQEGEPPADYHSPKPVFFVTVSPYSRFCFALALRSGLDPINDLEIGYELLKESLENLGCGGKTAVGYGRMIADPPIDYLNMFKQWFMEGDFRNKKGSHNQVIDKIINLPVHFQKQGKSIVSDYFRNKNECSPRLRKFLNEK